MGDTKVIIEFLFGWKCKKVWIEGVRDSCSHMMAYQNYNNQNYNNREKRGKRERAIELY